MPREVTRHGIEERIKELLISQLHVDPAALQDMNSNTPLLGHGVGLDSVETMALAVNIEEEFAISIPDTDLTADLFANLGALSDYILKALAACGTPDAGSPNGRAGSW